MFRTTAAISALALIAACGAADTAPATQATATEAPMEAATSPALTLTEIAADLEFPWGMAALPGGDMLVTEREGRLRILRGETLDPTPLTGLPGDIYIDRQGGLLDVALHPDFETNRLVYLSYSQGASDSNRTVVIRGALDEGATGLTGVEEVFAAHTPEKRGGG